MSTQEAPPRGAVASRVDGIADWIESLEATVEAQDETIQQLQTELEEERRQRRALEDRMQDRIAEMDRRTSLLTSADEMDDWSLEQYAAHAIQKLYTQAREKNREKVWVKVKTAWEDWFNVQIDRTSVYDVFEIADRKTGADNRVVRYINEPRGSNPPSRLQLDLTEGPVPEAIGPHPVAGCGRSTTPNDGVGAQREATFHPMNTTR